jgi:hypothetical protein
MLRLQGTHAHARTCGRRSWRMRRTVSRSRHPAGTRVAAMRRFPRIPTSSAVTRRDERRPHSVGRAVWDVPDWDVARGAHRGRPASDRTDVHDEGASRLGERPTLLVGEPAMANRRSGA